ncbi:DoxX subfamily protein [Longibacter salinarum]|uniref:DoxX subfamily protein n=1 Tax=Longibacter salinarum TaxID=1850348 RepID=A0A2A8CXU7_9BACT|nr:DoxX family membrane protein [Longibacter salinarum]PEN13450.1 DoxX subfamily protein [Longibacter salinarum]
MSTYRSIVDWIQSHQEVVLDIIRVYLGVGLLVRGGLFISQTSGISSLVDMSQFDIASAAIVHYVTFAHLIGGLLLAVGLLTRIAALAQIPVLVGAVFFVHLNEGLLSANQSLEFSALVLFLLVVVFVFGPGRWSADYYVFQTEEEDEVGEMWWRDEEEGMPVGGDGDPVPAGADTKGESGAGVAVAADVDTLPRRTTQEAPTFKTCECGNTVGDPEIIVEPQYGWTSGFFFMLGISAPVKEIVFYCQDCGTIVKRSKDAELRERYRWHTS